MWKTHTRLIISLRREVWVHKHTKHSCTVPYCFYDFPSIPLNSYHHVVVYTFEQLPPCDSLCFSFYHQQNVYAISMTFLSRQTHSSSKAVYAINMTFLSRQTNSSSKAVYAINMSLSSDQTT